MTLPIFPITPILDDFNRSDETPLSFGGKWPSALGNTLFTISLVSSEAISQATQDAAASRAWTNGSGLSYPSDNECYVTIGGTWSGNARIGVSTRVHSTGSASVKGYRMLASKPSDDISLHYFDGVSFTLLHSESFALASGDKIGLRSVGTRHYMYVYSSGAWQELEVVDDATYVGGTYDFALWLYTQNPRADDFGGGGLNFGQIIRHRRGITPS